MTTLKISLLRKIRTMGVSKKLRASLAVGAVLASCQLVGCGSDTVDYGGGGQSGTANTAGKAGGAQAGKAGHAAAGRAGEAEAGMAGEAEMGGGNQAGGNSGGSAGLGAAGAGAGGLTNGGKGGGTGTAGTSAGGAPGGAGGLANGGKGGGTGTAGTSAGTGGASAGTGGASAQTCGNNIVESAEICDPKFTVNNCGSDCKAITSAACLTCESAPGACDASILTCNTVTGNATEGPANGVAKSSLCNEALDCIRDTGCAADAKPLLKSCYCGTADVTNCNAGLGDGPCKAALERSLETTSATAISMRVGNVSYGGAIALKRVTCDQLFCDPICF